MKWLMLIPVTIAATMLLLACEPQGPLERAGEEIDEAVEDIKAGGETTGNKIDDAVDDARKKVEKAVDDDKPD